MRGVVAWAALGVACGYDRPALHDAGSSPDTTDGPVLVQKTQQFSNDLDVLFVIDNSASTSDKQTVFAANFPMLVQAFDSFPTGRPNLHIGVVDTTVDIASAGFGPGCPSPDPNDNGLLQNAPRVTGCAPPTGRFISDVRNATGGRDVNYTTTLDQAFACIAQVGATGCGFEAQLDAMKRAFDGTNPMNAGFLRDDANLAIVFLTDEDDASIADPAILALGSAATGPGDFRAQPLYAYGCDTPISPSAPGTYTHCVPRNDSYLRPTADYVTFLKTLKGTQQIAIAMIIGDPQRDTAGTATIMTGAITTPFNQTLALLPSCMATINGNTAIGRPGLRLAAFADAFGAHARTYTICQPDYSQALADIGGLSGAVMKPCLTSMIDMTDTDSANPGLQPACTFSVTTGGTPKSLPFCMMQTPDTPLPAQAECAWLGVDPACNTSTNLVANTNVSLLASGDVLAVTCPAQ